MSPRRGLAQVAAVALAALCSCRAPSRQAPDQAYRDFVDAAHAARAGNADGLLDRFDASTRAALQARATAASNATQKLMPADPAYQLMLGSASVGAVTAVAVVSTTLDKAELRVDTDGGSSGTVTMVFEKGWKVHLDL